MFFQWAARSIKRSIIKLTIFLIMISLTVPLFLPKKFYGDFFIEASVPDEGLVIVIDAGHGGEDCGAIGTTGVFEKDLNMQISMKLGDYLRAAGHSVVYTRTEDCLLYTEEENVKGFRKIHDLKNRVAIANSYENAILISIHMNSYGAEECSGLQVYYSSDSSKSKSLAQSIQKSVVNNLQPNNYRKIKSGDELYLLKNSTIPSVLVECGFVSNPQECKKLSEKEYQKELSFSILCGIIEYISNHSSE